MNKARIFVVVGQHLLETTHVNKHAREPVPPGRRSDLRDVQDVSHHIGSELKTGVRCGNFDLHGAKMEFLQVRFVADSGIDVIRSPRLNGARSLQRDTVIFALPRRFGSKEQWERFKKKIRRELPEVIGIPRFPAMKESQPRGRIRVGEDVVC